MTSQAKDQQGVTLVKVLVPLLQRCGPEGAGGYGGALQLHLASEVAAQLGGVAAIRTALRGAARELGWTFRTWCAGGGPADDGAIVGIHDTRPVPEPYAQAVERERQQQRRAAVERVAARFQDRPPAPDTPALRGTPAVQTKEFVAALTEHGLLR